MKFKIALGLCLISSISFINAQDPLQKNLLINGDFQTPQVESLQRFEKNLQKLNGWSGHDFQIGKAKFFNRNWPNQQVNQVAELDSYNSGELIQKIILQEGKYELRLDYAAKDGINFEGSKLQIDWNGAVVKEISPQNYDIHHTDLQVYGIEGQNTLILKGTGDQNSFGVTVDNIILIQAFSNNHEQNFKSLIQQVKEGQTSAAGPIIVSHSLRIQSPDAKINQVNQDSYLQTNKSFALENNQNQNTESFDKKNEISQNLLNENQKELRNQNEQKDLNIKIKNNLRHEVQHLNQKQNQKQQNDQIIQKEEHNIKLLNQRVQQKQIGQQSQQRSNQKQNSLKETQPQLTVENFQKQNNKQQLKLKTGSNQNYQFKDNKIHQQNQKQRNDIKKQQVQQNSDVKNMKTTDLQLKQDQKDNRKQSQIQTQNNIIKTEKRQSQQQQIVMPKQMKAQNKNQDENAQKQNTKEQKNQERKVISKEQLKQPFNLLNKQQQSNFNINQLSHSLDQNKQINFIKNDYNEQTKLHQPFTNKIEQLENKSVEIQSENLYNQNWDYQMVKTGDNSKQILTQIVNLSPGIYQLSFDWSNINNNQEKSEVEVFWNNIIVASLRSNQNKIRREVIRVNPSSNCEGKNTLEFRSSFENSGSTLVIDNISLVKVNKVSSRLNF